MSRYLLDTNIISNATKPEPSETLAAWMKAQADEDLFISVSTVAEVQREVLEKPAGKKRQALQDWFSGPEGPLALFAGRVLTVRRTGWAHLGAIDGRGECEGPSEKRARHDHRGDRRGE